MKTRTRIATACTAAVVASITLSGQASATPRAAEAGAETATAAFGPQGAVGTASCSTTGARGSMGASVPSGDHWPFDEFKIALSVTDTSADDHHVRVRLLTKPVGSQQVFKWPWRSNTKGNGETLTVSTTAQADYGIEHTGVEVARFEGDRKLNSCTDWN
ncbi:hypothetical protein AB0I06_26950 [Streptomyces sp. NPDC050674]|uniref:hypothetical protein n=1 Tax=Streptomyces sp. NPDC050674 TaxID=3157216 RepID=UPI0034345D01